MRLACAGPWHARCASRFPLPAHLTRRAPQVLANGVLTSLIQTQFKLAVYVSFARPFVHLSARLAHMAVVRTGANARDSAWRAGPTCQPCTWVQRHVSSLLPAPLPEGLLHLLELRHAVPVRGLLRPHGQQQLRLGALCARGGRRAAARRRQPHHRALVRRCTAPHRIAPWRLKTSGTRRSTCLLDVARREGTAWGLS